MKELILRRERIFHFLSLALIAVSMFLKEPVQKVTILMLGIIGLLILSALKKQKALIIVYAILAVAALVFFYWMTKDQPEVLSSFNY